MTRAQIVRVVRDWQARLGLDRWALEVEFAVFDNDRDAEVSWAKSYDEATVRFASDKIGGWSARRAAQVVVHELLHLSVRDLNVTLWPLEDQIHRDVYAVHEARFEHEMEGLVDRLSYRIVEIACG